MPQADETDPRIGLGPRAPLGAGGRFVACRAHDGGEEDAHLPLTRERKEELVEAMASRLGSAKAIIVTQYRGLDVAELTELRGRLRAGGASYHVVKNRLLRRAFALAEVEAPPDALLSGPTAIAVLGDDLSGPAKILLEFAKKHEQLLVMGGVMDNRPMDAKGVEVLSKLPTRDELLSQIIGVIQAPQRNLVSLLAAPARDLVRVLDAKVKKDEAAA